MRSMDAPLYRVNNRAGVVRLFLRRSVGPFSLGPFITLSHEARVGGEFPATRDIKNTSLMSEESQYIYLSGAALTSSLPGSTVIG